MRRARLGTAVAAFLALAAFSPLLAAGRASLDAYFQSTLKDAAYQKKTYERVASRWKNPAQFPAVGKKAVVRAVIDRSGKLRSSELWMSSGVKAWDAAAQAAVKGAAPYDPLPAGYRYETLEVDFHVSVVP